LALILRDKLVRCYRRQCSEKTVNYEIRYRKNGYNIYASSNDLEEAKRKFIEQLWSADARRDARFPAMARARRRRTCDYDRWDDYYDDDEDFGVPETFHKFAMYYFEKYRKRKVPELTYTNDMYRYNKHLKPYFGDMRLKAIRPDMCQELLDDLQERGLGKTNNEIHSILNNIMKNALAYGVIKRNPMTIVIVEKHKSTHGKALTKQEEKTLLVLDVGYDIENLTNPKIKETYTGEITVDYYGRAVPKHAHGTINLKRKCSSTKIITEATLELFDRIIDKNLLVRRLNVTACKLLREDEIQAGKSGVVQMDLFTDYEALEEEKRKEDEYLDKEKKRQLALLEIQKKYGKNAVLKGINYQEGATTKERNEQIGGHKA